MGALMRAHNWSATPLGPPESWPQSLRTVVRILLTSRYQMWMGWGEELSFFYNDAYRPTLGVKHGSALGASAREVWKEIWPDIGPRIDQVLQTGEATWDEGLLLFLERSGYHRRDLPYLFLFAPVRRRRRHRRHALRRHRGNRTRYRRTPPVDACASLPRRSPAKARARRSWPQRDRSLCGQPHGPAVHAHLSFRSGWRGPAGRPTGSRPGPSCRTRGYCAIWRRMRPGRRAIGRSTRRCCRSADLGRRFDRIPAGAGPSRRTRPRSPRWPSKASTDRPVFWSPALIRSASWTTAIADSSALLPGRSRRHRQRASLRGRAPTRRGAGGDRPGQDGVLLQCQPRVPHAADLDAEPARRAAGATRSQSAADSALVSYRSRTATRCGS